MTRRRREGVVSVVVVNYRGAQNTIACLQAFSEVEWPADKLELVVVDNASGGSDVEQIAEAVPHAVIVESATNRGFAGGCNLGVARAKGEYVVFINSDARPDPRYLSAAVSVLESAPDVGAVATKVLDWDGTSIDFVAAGMSWYGQAFKLGAGQPVGTGPEEERDVLFGTGSSLIMRADVFEEVGGFDEDYFMFFEDVDLGWRLWLLGYRVRYVPASISFHRHHASMSSIGSWREKYLLERNALFTIYKNYDEANLQRFLPGAMALAMRRGVVLGGDDATALDLAHGHDAEEGPTAEVSRTMLASAYALDEFARVLPELEAKRQNVQAQRRRTDAEILRLFGEPLQPNIAAPEFLATYQAVVGAFGVKEAFAGRKRIVVATGDTVSRQMAGPAIRAWQIASALSSEHDVQLVTTGPCDLDEPRFPVRHVNGREIVKLEKWADVIIFQGFLLHEHPVIRTSKKVVVVDLYDPFHLEQLEQARDLGERARREVVRSSTAVLNEQILRGDFFMCASEKQRDFWLGQMAGMGRINPAVYDADETLRSLISVVPFGVSDAPPTATKRMVKGVIPGIPEDAKVVLWGGGIYNWFDPLTLIRAIARVKDTVPEVRLLFMGVKHPNPAVPRMRMAVEAEKLARELGLLGSHVVFNIEWVAYEDRQNFLLESDIGVSTHLDHVETAYSFRTRILDYLWASLPIVCTDGDALAGLVKARELGRVVAAGDVGTLAGALVEILQDDDLSQRLRRNVASAAPEFRWSSAIEPLLEFCREPHRAPDLVDPLIAKALLTPVTVVPPRWGGLTGDVKLTVEYLKDGGPSEVLRKAAGRAKRLLLGRPRR